MFKREKKKSRYVNNEQIITKNDQPDMKAK